MSKDAQAVELIIAKHVTVFPDHALTEMENDPSQRSWWENWAAVGDAKVNREQLSLAILEADQEWRDCRARSGLSRAAGLECGCGEHRKQVEALLVKHTKAHAAVDKAVKSFKRGK